MEPRVEQATTPRIRWQRGAPSPVQTSIPSHPPGSFPDGTRDEGRHADLREGLSSPDDVRQRSRLGQVAVHGGDLDSFGSRPTASQCRRRPQLVCHLLGAQRCCTHRRIERRAGASCAPAPADQDPRTRLHFTGMGYTGSRRAGSADPHRPVVLAPHLEADLDSPPRVGRNRSATGGKGTPRPFVLALIPGCADASSARPSETTSSVVTVLARRPGWR